MKKSYLVSSVVFCLLGFCASSALADYGVAYVGDNPWSGSGFANTGGTGSHIGNTVEKTFTSLGDIPIIIDWQSAFPTGTLPDGPVDVPGAVEFLHIDERVMNNTGVDWTDFHLVVELIDADPNLDVEFLNIIDQTNNWDSTNTGKGFLSLFGSVPDGETFSLSFDLQLNSQEGAFNLFGIHEFPTVPSPGASTLALIGCSIVGLIKRRSGVRASA